MTDHRPPWKQRPSTIPSERLGSWADALLPLVIGFTIGAALLVVYD